MVNPARGRRGYEINVAEEKLARRLDGRSLFFSTDIKMSGKNIVRTYFQKDHIEKAFRFLKGDACLSPVRYQQPGRVEAYLSVINFISYELIAALYHFPVIFKIRLTPIDANLRQQMRKSVKSASKIITGITGFWNSAVDSCYFMEN